MVGDGQAHPQHDVGLVDGGQHAPGAEVLGDAGQQGQVSVNRTYLAHRTYGSDGHRQSLLSGLGSAVGHALRSTGRWCSQCATVLPASSGSTSFSPTPSSWSRTELAAVTTALASWRF